MGPVSVRWEEFSSRSPDLIAGLSDYPVSHCGAVIPMGNLANFVEVTVTSVHVEDPIIVRDIFPLEKKQSCNQGPDQAGQETYLQNRTIQTCQRGWGHGFDWEM